MLTRLGFKVQENAECCAHVGLTITWALPAELTAAGCACWAAEASMWLLLRSLRWFEDFQRAIRALMELNISNP